MCTCAAEHPCRLAGSCTPGEYFDRFSDSAQLCALLCGYISEGVPVPDPLLDRLAELGDEAALMALAKDKSAPARRAWTPSSC